MRRKGGEHSEGTQGSHGWYGDREWQNKEDKILETGEFQQRHPSIPLSTFFIFIY